MEQALKEAPLLRPGPTRNLVNLTQQLRKVDDPLSEYLRERFSPGVRDVLEAHTGAEPPPLAVQQAVMGQIARLSDDIKDPSGLAGKLRDGNEPLSAYLRGKLSQPTRALLDAYQGPDLPPDALAGVLIDDLNEVLRQDVHLQEQDSVSLLGLPAWARRLMRQVTQGDSLVRLNRVIFEKAFPEEIAEAHANPFEVVVQPIEGFVGAAQLALEEKLAAHDGIVLYKIHGSFFDEEPPDGFPPVVITEEDYIQFLTLIGREDGSIPRMIKSKIASCNLLFLGYGLEDWDFRTLYKGDRSVPRNKQRESFAIQYDPPEYWVRFWEQNGVFIYNMDIYEFTDELEQRCRAYRASPG